MPLRVVGWNQKFENNRTRELRAAAWFAMPNRLGAAAQRLLAMDDGLKTFGVAVLCFQMASANTGTRGELAEDGRYLTARDIAAIARISLEEAELHIARLLEEWVLEEFAPFPQVGAAIPQVGAAIPQVGAAIPQVGAPRAMSVCTPSTVNLDIEKRARTRDAREGWPSPPEKPTPEARGASGVGEPVQPPDRAPAGAAVAARGCLDDGWNEFEAAWREFAETCPSDADWAKARSCWRLLDHEQRALAASWLSGPEKLVRPARAKMVYNYLGERTFTRKQKAATVAAGGGYTDAVRNGFQGSLEEWRAK